MSDNDIGKSRQVRDWVYIALFGALWGAVEISLGSLLHIIFPPLTNTFITGLVLAAIAVILVLSGASFISKPYSIILIGAVAALLKLFSFGGVKLGPILAILIQAGLMQLIWLIPSYTRPAESGGSSERASRGEKEQQKGAILYAIAGLLAVSWNFFHRFIMLRLLYGKKIVEIAKMMAKNGESFLSIDASRILTILIIFIIIRMAVGSAAGAAAYSLSRGLKRRLRG